MSWLRDQPSSTTDNWKKVSSFIDASENRCYPEMSHDIPEDIWRKGSQLGADLLKQKDDYMIFEGELKNFFQELYLAMNLLGQLLIVLHPCEQVHRAIYDCHNSISIDRNYRSRPSIKDIRKICCNLLELF